MSQGFAKVISLNDKLSVWPMSTLGWFVWMFIKNQYV